MYVVSCAVMSSAAAFRAGAENFQRGMFLTGCVCVIVSCLSVSVVNHIVLQTMVDFETFNTTLFLLGHTCHWLCIFVEV